MRKMGHGPWVVGVLVAVLCLPEASRAQTVKPQPAPPQTAAPTAPVEQATPAPVLEAPEQPPVPAPATPQVPLGTRVEVLPGASCLERERLLRRVARWLERDTVDDDIRVRVQGDARDEYEVVFTVQKGANQPSERRIADAPEECGQLHAAVALSIALAIDAAIADAKAPTVELPDDDTLVEVPEPEEPAYLRVAGALTGQASSGVLPGVALGAGGRVELGFLPWLDLRAGAMLTAINDERIGSLSGTFSAEIVAGRLDLCAAFDGAPKARLLACAAGMLGRFRTTGQGFSPSQDQSEAWLAVGLGVEAQVETAAWLDIALSLDVVLPTARRTIQTVDTEGDQEDKRVVTKAGVLVAVGPVFHFF